MRKLTTLTTGALALLLLPGLPASSQDAADAADKAATPAPTTPVPADLSTAKAKQAVETLFGQFVEANNRRDPKATVAFFCVDTEVAMVTEESGAQKVSGRDNFEQVMRGNFEENPEDRISAHTVLSASFAGLNSLSAVVAMETKRTPSASATKHLMALIMEKRMDRWQIAVLRFYPNVSMSPATTTPATTTPATPAPPSP